MVNIYIYMNCDSKINVCIHNICVYAVYIYYVIHHLRKICYAYILYNINYMNINIYMQILSKYIRMCVSLNIHSVISPKGNM